jgi:hypothetical protein
LKFNLRASKREDMREFTANYIMKRLKKISRYDKAAITIHAFKEKLVKNNKIINLYTVFTSKTRIPELNNQLINDL